jgi:hypothetical protein
VAADERRSERANVILTATLECAGAAVPVRVSNISAHGALVVGTGIPCDGSQVIFRCNGKMIESWIAWSRERHAGIQFDAPVDVEALTKRERTSSPQIVKDTRDVDFRRPGFKGNQMTEEERRFFAEWVRGETGASSEGDK